MPKPSKAISLANLQRLVQSGITITGVKIVAGGPLFAIRTNGLSNYYTDDTTESRAFLKTLGFEEHL